MTRGQRNHNPLNIRRSDRTHWLGQKLRQLDREFVQFQSDLFGLRAAFRILRTYLRLYGLCTLRQVIYRWAPPEDGNNTETYVRTVAERAGVLPDAFLQWTDEDTLIRIVNAMAWVESHMDFADSDLLQQAYRMVK
jgi:hypothetical protein